MTCYQPQYKTSIEGLLRPIPLSRRLAQALVEKGNQLLYQAVKKMK